MKRTKIEFVNQAGGLLPREFVKAAAETYGPVLYHTADPVAMEAPVTLVPSPPYRRKSIVSRLSSWLHYGLVIACRILLTPRRPLLFFVTNPPFSPLIGYIAKKLKGQPYVILFYDTYPEAMERFTGVSPSSAISRILRYVNKISIRNADAVITISKGLEQTLAQYYPQEKSNLRTYIIPTWVDTDVIKPMAKSENWFAKEHGQLEKLTVLYGGNLGSAHDLSMLPDLVAALRDDPGIHFLILADRDGRRSLEVQCSSRSLTNITFLPLQEEEVLPFSLSTADVGLVALAPEAEGVSMPSKTYYLMAAGCAVLGLTSPHSDLAEVIQMHKCGTHVLPDDVAGAAAAIREFRANPEALATCRYNARLAAEKQYSRERCVAEMLATLAPILNPTIKQDDLSF